MPSSDRDFPLSGEAFLRHQHSSSSDQGFRSLVPMWDSSDPERCPPPLPLNPQSPLTSRAGTSSAIQAAHSALNERAQAALTPSHTKRNDHSPERALVKGSHRRMQSSVRDLSLLIEGSGSPNVSPTKSPEKFTRPSTPIRSNTDSRLAGEKEKEKEKEKERETAVTMPAPGPSLTPILRPSARRLPPQSILGENTPPQSSTMLALQNMNTQPTPMKEPEPPLSNITNGSTALVKHPQPFDHISHQILSLTNIATCLQKEMSQLSRRSRDNATDLLSLKEATNTRDEDIRKSLRELLGYTSTKGDNNSNNNEPPKSRTAPRDPFGGFYLDNKPHNASPDDPKPYQLPRISSPKSFSDSLDRASISTPSLSGSEGTASIALLEKVIREMGTREGQEALRNHLLEISGHLSGLPSTAKIDELIEQVKEAAQKAVVPASLNGRNDAGRTRQLSFEDESSQLELALNQPKGRVEHILKNENRRNSAPPSRGSELLNDDLINIIRSVKDSVAQGGGLTAEVKALVRELRGEVLGMGREIGRRLEQQAATRRNVDDHDSPSKDEVARVIDEGLEQMKDQLNHVLREHRRASAASATSQKTAVDYQEIYNAMRAALRDNEASNNQTPDLSRDDVIEAVRDAWENYKPEIEVQQLGLERDEVLACLKEGLLEYAPKNERPAAATRDEVFQAVVEGLKHFVPPQVDTPATLSRDEIIDAVRDCLEEFEFPIAASAIGNHNEFTKEDMVHAVREGLHDFDLTQSRALVAQSSSSNDEVVARLQDMLEYMRREFKAVSEEAKENVAANGRDTEQVLDATKDGLENLRKAIEGYVDQAAGVSGQEEFLDDMLKSLDDFKDEIADLVSKSNEESRKQLQTELDGLREIVNNSMVPAMPPPQNTNPEIMETLHTGFNSLRQEILRPRAETSDILDALNDGLNDLRAGVDRIANKPMDLTANDEILDALKAGLDSLRVEIESIREATAMKAVATIGERNPHDEVLDALKLGLDAVRSDIDNLRDIHEKAAAKSADKAPSEEILTTLRGGLDTVRSDIEALRDSHDKAVATVDPAPNEVILDTLKTGLDTVRADIEALRESTVEKAVVPIDETANSDILDAVKTGLDTVRSDIEGLRDSHDKAVTAASSSKNDEILNALKTGLESVRVEVEALRDSSNDRALATVTKDAVAEKEEFLKHEDIRHLEVLISELQTKIEGVGLENESVRKDDFTRMEEILRNVRDTVEDISTRETTTAVAAVPREKKEPRERDVNGDEAASKDDVQAIETILRNTKGRLDDLIEGEQAVRKEHVENVEALILEAQESIGTITTNVDTINTQMDSITAELGKISHKEDIKTLESLISQITVGLDEIKERAIKDSENPENVVKSDVEAVETVVLEIKSGMDGLIASTDFTGLASKESVTSLETIVKEFAEKLESIVDASTKAVAVRNTEMTGVGERVTEVKNFLEEFQGTIRTKLEEGSTGIGSLGKILESLSAKIDKNDTIGVDLKLMFDTMKTEFEDSKTVAAGAKLESDEKVQEATDNLAIKIDEKIDELIEKYDDLQEMLDEKAKVSEAREVATEAAVVGTKAIADELKLLIDTLGTTVTDSLEKMEEASMTVFTKVEDLVTKNEENHTEDKAEHKQTRDQVTEAMSLVEGLKGEVSDYQPKILEAVKDLLVLVGEHFEHSKSSTTDIQDKLDDSKPSEALRNMLPPEKYDNTEVLEKLSKLAADKYDDSELRERLDKLAADKYDDAEVRQKLDQIIEHKYDDAEVREKLDVIIEQKYDDTEVREKLDVLAGHRYDDAEVRQKLDQIIEHKYDDAAVNEKLDKLVDHTSTADQAFSRLDTLDKVHASVVKTAADISEFLSAQTQRIADEHDDREKTLQETTLAVERKLAEQDHLEASILSLRDEEERLRKSVMSLRTEQESLIRQKTRLTGDVSSLETAMRLRKEELYEMELRAESLERRIFEGVMDHSRVLLMSKGNKGGDAMSRKRVKKPAKESEAGTTPRKTGVNIALAARRSLAPQAQNGSSRRIVSLSQINNNVASGGVKRSQSVRTPAGGGKSYRKRSWGGDLDKGFNDHDKENVGMKETVEEVEEPETQLTIHPSSARARELELLEDETTALNSTLDDDGGHSDNETLRRSSRGTTVITNSTDMYSDGEYSEYSDDERSDLTESALGPASSVGTHDEVVEGHEMVVYGH